MPVLGGYVLGVIMHFHFLSVRSGICKNEDVSWNNLLLHNSVAKKWCWVLRKGNET